VDLSGTAGREQRGRRPALVVSSSLFNRGPSGLVIVIPVTGTERRVLTHVRLSPPEASLRKTSFVMCENLRAVSRQRLSRRLGAVSGATMERVEDLLRTLLEL